MLPVIQHCPNDVYFSISNVRSSGSAQEVPEGTDNKKKNEVGGQEVKLVTDGSLRQ